MQSIDNTAAQLVGRIRSESRTEAEVLAVLETKGASAALGVEDDVRESAIRLLRGAIPRGEALSLGAMEPSDSFKDVCDACEQDADAYSPMARR